MYGGGDGGGAFCTRTAKGADVHGMVPPLTLLNDLPPEPEDRVALSVLERSHARAAGLHQRAAWCYVCQIVLAVDSSG
jgi:hypothetical protein